MPETTSPWTFGVHSMEVIMLFTRYFQLFSFWARWYGTT